MSKLKVRKRDGSIQDFDINKIRKVVKDAFNTTKETVDESKLNKLLDTIGLKNYDENYIIDIILLNTELSRDLKIFTQMTRLNLR